MASQNPSARWLRAWMIKSCLSPGLHCGSVEAQPPPQPQPRPSPAVCRLVKSESDVCEKLGSGT